MERNALIVEDEILIAKDLKNLLNKMNYQCVGIARKGEVAIELFEQNSVDIVLCDINIEGDMDGIDTIHQMMNHKRVPVIYLTALADDKTASRALDTIPYAYLLKPYNERSLQIAINLAINNFQHIRDKIVNPDFEKIFTKREKEIIKLIAEGKTTIDISEQLFISEMTVSKHRSNILEKSACKSTSEVIAKYFHQA